MNMVLPKTLTQWILLVCGSMLLLDALVLFGYGKINFGTVVPGAIGLIFLMHVVCWQRMQGWLRQSVWLKRFWQLAWGGFVVWLLSFIGFACWLQHHIHHQPKPNHLSALIVLGAGVNGDNPTPTLANRLDTAARVLQQSPHVVPIVTGGVGFARDKSEAFVMASYLQRTHHIDFQRIAQEGKSTSTEENLKFSKAILAKRHITLTQPIAIVTSDFHTMRAKKIAHKLGYRNVITLPSNTPRSIRFNAWFREYFAFISGWLLGEY